MFGKGDDFVIPWDAIKRIGDDIILVDYESHYARNTQSTKKRGAYSYRRLRTYLTLAIRYNIVVKFIGLHHTHIRICIGCL
jgi:hypothetical protein